ncbi:MAG: hypothetical protein AAF965_04150 [Pseudomonadota bacterium]
MSFVLPKALRYTLIAFYVYGAMVHLANMAGWTGFDWQSAPEKWQFLDVGYLFLDLAVVAGLLTRKVWGTVLLIVAASSQILLYTLFRAWVLDVPPAFEVDPSDAAYLDGLLLFHAVCLGAVGLVIWHARTARKVRSRS